MATLRELMAEFDIGEEHTKQASVTKTSKDEIDQVLENLGIGDAETVKTASENENKDGGSMGLQDIYEKIMGEDVSAQEKVASETPATEETSQEKVASSSFGELTGEYFNVVAAPYFEKVAGDLEVEAGQGHAPMGDLDEKSSLGKSLGQQADPHLKVNHAPKNGQRIDAATGGKSPYSLKEKALLKAILSRSAAGEVGNVVE
jgi:hypothetical protein